MRDSGRWCIVLTTVCISSSVSHADEASRVNLSPADVLVLELFTVYRSAPGTIALRNVAALDHELVDDAVKW